MVLNVENVRPVADAGPDQIVSVPTTVTLDGSGSSDADNDPLTFQWSATSVPPGSSAVLSDSSAVNATLNADVPGSYIIQLIVNDETMDSAPDSVIITGLQTDNVAPDCSSVYPSDQLLWPPNHKFMTVDILGITDVDGDRVDVVVTDITQDEPVKGKGDGNTSPDAIILDGGVKLRSERSGKGNGRVYEIHISATDTQGASCEAAVIVGVPHNKKKVAFDDGQFYDSTE